MEIVFLLFIIFISFGLVTLISVAKGVSRIFVRSDKSQTSYTNHNKYRAEKNSKTRKIFGSNEGQYINYEEIKE